MAKKKPVIQIVVGKVKDKMKGGQEPPKEDMGPDYDEGLMYLEAFEKAKDPQEKLFAMMDLHDYMHRMSMPEEG